jgi:DNA modification methylase
LDYNLSMPERCVTGTRGYSIIQGDVLEVTKGFDDNTFDGMLCDPPYGLSFMGKEWDHGVPSAEVWQEILRTLKPGAFAMVFGGTRTWHRLAVALEDAGFEMRDTLMWLYGSGFPKGYRIDNAVRQLLGEDAVCQCGDNRHNTVHTSHKHKKDVRKHKGGLLDGDASLLGDVQHSSNKSLDSQVDYQQDCDLCGESVHPSLGGGQAFSQRQECAQGYSHFSAPSDAGVPEQGYNPSQVQHNDRLSNQDYSSPDSEGIDTLKRTRGSNKPVDICESPDRKRDNNQDVSYSDYISGLPRCQVCGKPIVDIWKGYNVALKPAWEPVLLVRKPLDGTNAQNALKHGCGGLNIDGGRISTKDKWHKRPTPLKPGAIGYLRKDSPLLGRDTHPKGRWPANLILDEESAAMLDEMSGELSSHGGGTTRTRGIAFSPVNKQRRKPYPVPKGDSGGASRFFYCAKASSKERNAGLEGFEEQTTDDGRKKSIDNAYQRGETLRRNNHPTVKPLALCKYLAILLLPPARLPSENGGGRKLLVPFAGSGSEMIGAIQAGWDDITGIEIDPEYCKIAEARIEHWIKQERLKAPLFAKRT